MHRNDGNDGNGGSTLGIEASSAPTGFPSPSKRQFSRLGAWASRATRSDPPVPSFPPFPPFSCSCQAERESFRTDGLQRPPRLELQILAHHGGRHRVGGDVEHHHAGVAHAL